MTPLSDDDKLTDYLWTNVREMIKTAIENNQNMIVEGCYIPFDWYKDFGDEYLKSIKYYCIVLSENYIKTHFSDIKKYANVIENRLCDELDIEDVIKDNAYCLKEAEAHIQNVILIDNKYEVELQ